MHKLTTALIITTLLVASCGPKGTSFRVKGSFTDMEGGELYAYNLSDEHARLDTIIVRNGSFIYGGDIEEVTPMMLVFPNAKEQVIFIAPGTEVSYQATANDMKSYEVKGGEENQLLMQFRMDTRDSNPADTRKAVVSFIKEHPQSAVSVYLLDRYMVQDTEVPVKTISAALDSLLKAQPGNRYLQTIEGRIRTAEATDIGKTIPDFAMPNFHREKLKLWRKSSDYTMLYFWATWCANQYQERERIKRIASENQNGNMRFVTISFDNELYNWESYVRSDSAYIENYIQTMAFNSDISLKCGITSLPTYIITDKKHKVVFKTSDIAEAETKIKSYLKHRN